MFLPRLPALPALTVTLATALAASPVAAETIERDFNHRFDTGSDARLVLRHGDGDVTIEAWDQDAIEVDVRYRLDATRIGIGSRNVFDVSFEERGTTLYVIGKEKRAGGIGVFASTRQEHSYRVRAPRHVVLELSGDDGNIEIDGWHGDIRIDLDDGNIDLREIDASRTVIQVEDGDTVIAGLRGELDLTADDGDVTVRDCDSERIEIDVEDGDIAIDRCQGHLAIFTDDGEVSLSDIRATVLDVETADGDIEAELRGGQRLDAQFTTDDGSVRLAVADDVRASFTITMDDGPVDIDIPGADVETGKHRVAGILGGAANDSTIRIDTNDGRVRLRTAR